MPFGSGGNGVATGAISGAAFAGEAGTNACGTVGEGEALLLVGTVVRPMPMPTTKATTNPITVRQPELWDLGSGGGLDMPIYHMTRSDWEVRSQRRVQGHAFLLKIKDRSMGKWVGDVFPNDFNGHAYYGEGPT